jgi:hypothetical protein
VTQNKLNQALYERRIYKRQAENWRFAFIGLSFAFVCFIAILGKSLWPVLALLLIALGVNHASITRRIHRIPVFKQSSK